MVVGPPGGQQMVDGHAIELWQEARKIATFGPVARMDGKVVSGRRDGRFDESI